MSARTLIVSPVFTIPPVFPSLVEGAVVVVVVGSSEGTLLRAFATSPLSVLSDGSSGSVGEGAVVGSCGASVGSLVAEGSDGSVGFDGVVGVDGVVGLLGVVGALGVVGVDGVVGLLGVVGLFGATGVTGLLGVTGVRSLPTYLSAE